MAFHDVSFPPRIAEGAEGGPEFSTSVVTSSGGREQRIGNWAIGRGRWNVGTGLQNAADYATLLAFFRARQGKLHSFRFRDWSDYALPRQAIGATNGTLATWQVFKRYTSGGINADRPLTKLVSGTVRCWVAGVERTIGAGTSQFQVNLATGVITLGATLAALSAQAIEAQAEFDVPCRFDVDALSLRLNAFEIGEWPDVPIVELVGE